MSIVETNEERNMIVPESNLEIQKKVDPWIDYDDKTISELLSSTEVIILHYLPKIIINTIVKYTDICIQVEKCKVVATIFAIDTAYSWYYFGCELCQHRTFKVLDEDSLITKPLFWCEDCKKNVTNVKPK